MEFIHYSLDLGARDVIQVELESKAFVRLMDDQNIAVCVSLDGTELPLLRGSGGKITRQYQAAV